MGKVTDAYLAGFEAGYDLAVDLVRGQAMAADIERSMDEVHRAIESAPSCIRELREVFRVKAETESALERIARLSGDVKFTFAAESHRCDSGAGQGGHGGADGCNNQPSDVLRRFSADVEDA